MWSYLAEQFRQIKLSLAEQFCHINVAWQNSGISIEKNTLREEVYWVWFGTVPPNNFTILYNEWMKMKVDIIKKKPYFYINYFNIIYSICTYHEFPKTTSLNKPMNHRPYLLFDFLCTKCTITEKITLTLKLWWLIWTLTRKYVGKLYE